MVLKLYNPFGTEYDKEYLESLKIKSEIDIRYVLSCLVKEFLSDAALHDICVEDSCEVIKTKKEEVLNGNLAKHLLQNKANDIVETLKNSDVVKWRLISYAIKQAIHERGITGLKHFDKSSVDTEKLYVEWVYDKNTARHAHNLLSIFWDDVYSRPWEMSAY